MLKPRQKLKPREILPSTIFHIPYKLLDIAQ